MNECILGNLCVFRSCENVPRMFLCVCDKGYELDSGGGNRIDVGSAGLGAGRRRSGVGEAWLAPSLSSDLSRMPFPEVWLV